MNYRSNLKIPWALIIIIFLINRSADAQSIWKQDHLLGDWNGVRTSLSDGGIDFSVIYTGDVISNLSGGLSRQTVYLDNIDLTAAFNTEKLFNWQGGSIFIYGLGNQGKNPSDYIGDIQTADNIAAFNTWKVYEAWVQQILFNDHLSVLAGLYNLNSEFQDLESSGLFLNSSHGIGIAFSQSGSNGPSIFPTTSLALRLKFELEKSIYIQTALFNGTAGDPADPYGTKIIFPQHDGILSATELQYYINTSGDNDEEEYRESRNRLGRFGESDYKGKFAFGYWIYSAKFPEIESINSANKLIAGNMGFYFIGEYKISGQGGVTDKGLTVFSRIGFANSKINRFVSYTGIGAVYTGLIPGMDDDQLGIALAGAHNGEQYIAMMKNANQPSAESEWNIELSYLCNLAPWLSLQPDMQYVINPDTNPLIKNAFVADIRAAIVF